MVEPRPLANFIVGVLLAALLRLDTQASQGLAFILAQSIWGENTWQPLCASACTYQYALAPYFTREGMHR